MLHAKDNEVRQLLLKGNFGLEKESLRITSQGFMAHTPHPFPDEENIVRDFGENQTEINTPVVQSAEAAVAELERFNCRIQQTLAALPERELLWPFSNPPYIRDEEDIPVALFEGELAGKRNYRDYLSDRYGRYRMVLCGIHFNYSFADELLEADFSVSGQRDFRTYKDQLYVDLAQQAASYGWLITAVTAASPLTDPSFSEKGRFGGASFDGMSSIRCSELGYWNFFTPIFDYSNLSNYIDSLQRYVDAGLIRSPTELYYPIRLKPAGRNTLTALRDKGVNHIELRNIDLNPLSHAGADVRDVTFAQLLLVWLASIPCRILEERDQVQAVQNFKSAAHYDLKTVKMVTPDGKFCSGVRAALNVIASMKEFYADFPAEVHQVLSFEEEKFLNVENRYAQKVRHQFDGDFVKKGLELAKSWQESYL